MTNNTIKILAILLVGLIVSFIGIYDEHHRNIPIKTELVDFINVGLVECQVIKSHKYKFSGIGYYTKVKTNCSDTYYPILFDQMAEIDDNLFEQNPVIHKEASSKIVYVQSDKSKVSLTILDPQDMEDYSFLYFIWFFVAGFIIIIYATWKNYINLGGSHGYKE